MILKNFPGFYKETPFYEKVKKNGKKIFTK
jgi:hypothetical protein